MFPCRWKLGPIDIGIAVVIVDRGAGGGFVLTAAEAITVSGHQYALPGMGSYIGAAIAEGSLGKVGIAVAVMVIFWWSG